MQQSTTQKATQTERLSRCYVSNHEDVWLQVLPMMQEMHAMHEDQDWSIAGIKQSLDDGESLLLLDPDQEDAFAVVRVDDYPYKAGELELYITLVYHKGGDAIRRFQHHFESLARAAGANYLRFGTRRPGMFRLATAVGYVPRTLEFTKEL